MTEGAMPSRRREPIPRVCEECGSDTWFAKEFERMRDANYRLQAGVERLARENGYLRWKVEDAEARAKEEKSYLSRKVGRQAKVIVRLQEKLRALGKKPYEGMGHTTAPAAQYDVVEAER